MSEGREMGEQRKRASQQDRGEEKGMVGEGGEDRARQGKTRRDKVKRGRTGEMGKVR